MTVEYKRPDPADIPHLEAGFVTRRRAMDLMSMTLELGAEGAMSVSDIYNFVAGEGNIDSTAAKRAILADPVLHTRYRDFLNRESQYVLIARAASSDELPPRDGQGCKIRFQPSQAEPSQVYVLIELDDSSMSAPTTLFVDGDETALRVSLPDARDGVIQLLEERYGDTVMALANPDNRVVLT